jgi:HAD superfamily hydrolase (TIGR01509 family)
MFGKFLIFFSLLTLTVNAAVQQNSIRAVAFDFGGVVGTFDKAEIEDFLINSLQISQADAEDALKEVELALKHGGREYSYWQHYAQEKGKRVSRRWFEEYRQVQVSAFREIPGTLDIVYALKRQGIETPMLSNTTPDHADVIRRLGLYRPFYPLLLSYQIGAEKPNPKAYKILLRRLHLPPGAVAFVDNTPANVEAADRLGIHGIVFTSAESLRESLKELGIDLQTTLQVSGHRGFVC